MHYSCIMELTYTDKVALVSGAGRGIGREIALELAKAGCTVICVSRNESSCGGVAEEIRACGGKAESFAFDVSDSGQVKEKCAEILKKYGAVDILVNNAGITRDNLLMRMSDEEWKRATHACLTELYALSKELGGQLSGEHGIGNGRLDAVANAIQTATGMDFHLEQYSEHSLDGGSTSRAASYVGLVWGDGTTTWGAGTDTDIIVAGIKALVSAINNK